MQMKRSPTSTTTVGDPLVSSVGAGTTEMLAAQVVTTQTAPKVATTPTVARTTTQTVRGVATLTVPDPMALTAQTATMEKIIRGQGLKTA